MSEKISSPTLDRSPPETSPAPVGPGERAWTDPRTGHRWIVTAAPSDTAGRPTRPPRIITFRSEVRSYWIGYCGRETLDQLTDSALVLLLDSSLVAVA